MQSTTTLPFTFFNGIKELQKVLTKQRPILATSPILLISSSKSNDADREQTLKYQQRQHQSTHSSKRTALKQQYQHIDNSCRQVQFLLSQQLNLRTVPATTGVSDQFTTLPYVQKLADLLTRTGATTVCGVGSDVAMEVAKAVVTTVSTTNNNSNSRNDNKIERLILIPTTFSSTILAAMPYALLLDEQEDSLILPMDGAKKVTDATAETTVATVIDSNSNQQMHQVELAKYACAALIMGNVNSLSETKQQLDRLFNSSNEGLVEILLETSANMSFGFDNSPRNVSLALAASLLPKRQYFTDEVSLLSFWSSLAPSLSAAIDLSFVQDDPALPPKLITSVPLTALLEDVRSNQALWGCNDVNEELLTQVLKNHVLL